MRLPASYSAELAAVRALRADATTSVADAAALANAAAAARPHLPIGTDVLIFAGGRRGVLVGQVIKRGRTCYHVRTAQGQLAVPAPLVQPL